MIGSQLNWRLSSMSNNKRPRKLNLQIGLKQRNAPIPQHSYLKRKKTMSFNTQITCLLESTSSISCTKTDSFSFRQSTISSGSNIPTYFLIRLELERGPSRWHRSLLAVNNTSLNKLNSIKTSRCLEISKRTLMISWERCSNRTSPMERLIDSPRKTRIRRPWRKLYSNTTFRSKTFSCTWPAHQVTPLWVSMIPQSSSVDRSSLEKKSTYQQWTVKWLPQM